MCASDDLLQLLATPPTERLGYGSCVMTLSETDSIYFRRAVTYFMDPSVTTLFT